MSTPTLYDWPGGEQALVGPIDAFYDRVEGDELLAPLFGVVVVFEHAPVPRWGWGDAPPYQP